MQTKKMCGAYTCISASDLLCFTVFSECNSSKQTRIEQVGIEMDEIDSRVVQDHSDFAA